MKKIILLLVLITSLVSGAEFNNPYDPGAARSTLSNVTPATGRAALGLGTMAVATSTDYVATDTFIGHADATGSSVHGLGTISTVNSPVPVADGGTGATTAAAGLAALGGASSSVIIWQSSENLFATSDTASKVSVYKSGSDWVIKNNSTARTFFYHIVGTGNGANP